MKIDEITALVDDLDGVLTVRPGPGDGTPEIAWGDVFFYYAPDGVMPTTTQPFATIVTKNYPDDEASRLDRPDAFRVNVAAGKDSFVHWTGHDPRAPAASTATGPGTGTDADADTDADDTVIAHPVYGSLGWLAVVNPGERTGAATRELLLKAHELARARYERRSARSGEP
ncbi:hypothetical protein CLV30_11649 [Haloactinopolyspora alba]|uniref:DUF6194 domain-containing protein n=1 Tax=Haloactinopolyspora alba TaxID=648780 RepID=A0A2P8DT48_9ACTN|nr:DUF6194 family protein [Haloactinopolyspora alba]PSL00389.1 hypothetical protein CLV30_11649 [Haloactinopolyspora alba]